MRVPGRNLTPFTRKRRLGSSCKHLTTQDPNNLNCPFTQTWRGMLGMCELHLRRSSVLPAPFTITTFHLLQLGSSLCILINSRVGRFSPLSGVDMFSVLLDYLRPQKMISFICILPNRNDIISNVLSK